MTDGTRRPRHSGGSTRLPPIHAVLSVPETGHLRDRFPYVRVGNGPRTLVVLPGLGDAMFDGNYPLAAAWGLQAYFARYLDDHAVYLVSRPRGLPEGYTARESARDHADALSGLGPADVLGISTGGLIAQQLAVVRPDLVDRLVLASTACRLGDAGRPRVRRMQEYALDRDWAAIRAELASGMFSDVRRYAYPPLIRTVGRMTLPKPAVPSDVTRTIELILDYDGTDDLPDLDRPTLVFAGSDDPYFTEDVVRETARGIPDATLSLVRGKHAAFHERKLTFDDRVTDFFERTPSRIDDG